MSRTCPLPDFHCDTCDCAGITCQSRFPGLKVDWPELKGVSGAVAKKIIESDNPKVTCLIIPPDVGLFGINCCNRVILRVPRENCPNGPVLNRPQVG